MFEFCAVYCCFNLYYTALSQRGTLVAVFPLSACKRFLLLFMLQHIHIRIIFLMIAENKLDEVLYENSMKSCWFGFYVFRQITTN